MHRGSCRKAATFDFTPCTDLKKKQQTQNSCSKESPSFLGGSKLGKNLCCARGKIDAAHLSLKLILLKWQHIVSGRASIRTHYPTLLNKLTRKLLLSHENLIGRFNECPLQQERSTDECAKLSFDSCQLRSSRTGLQSSFLTLNVIMTFIAFLLSFEKKSPSVHDKNFHLWFLCQSICSSSSHLPQTFCVDLTRTFLSLPSLLETASVVVSSFVTHKLEKQRFGSD